MYQDIVNLVRDNIINTDLPNVLLDWYANPGSNVNVGNTITPEKVIILLDHGYVPDRYFIIALIIRDMVDSIVTL